MPQRLHIGYVALQIQTDPAVINEYLGRDLSEDAYKDLHFAAHAAIIGQLDKDGLAEAIRPLSTPYPVSFYELAETLDDAYSDAVRPRLRRLGASERWQPVFAARDVLMRLEQEPNDEETSDEPSNELTTEALVEWLLSNKYDDGPGAFVRRVEAMNDILVARYQITEAEVVATLIAKSRVVKVIASGATDEGEELSEGDPYNLLSAGDSKFPGRLQLHPDPELRGSKGLKDFRGCAAMKNGQLFNKLQARAIHDSLRCGLLGKITIAA